MNESLYESQSGGVYATGGRWAVTMPDKDTLSFKAKKRGEHRIPYDKVKSVIGVSSRHIPRLSSEGELSYDPYGRLIIHATEGQKISLLYDGHNLVLDAYGKGSVTMSVTSVYALVEAYEREQDTKKKEIRRSKKIKESIRHGIIPRELADLIHQKAGDLAEESDDEESMEDRLELPRRS